jgi:hypothetical protein
MLQLSSLVFFWFKVVLLIIAELSGQNVNLILEEMQPFTVQAVALEKVCHDKETGYSSLTYFSSAPPQTFFDSLEEDALTRRWKRIRNGDTKRTYRRLSAGPFAVVELTTVIRQPNSRRVTLIYEGEAPDSYGTPRPRREGADKCWHIADITTPRPLFTTSLQH